MIDRRSLLSGAAVTLGFAGLSQLVSGCTTATARGPIPLGLNRDPQGILDLPAGFTYRILSRTGDRMSDGLATPGAPDGMAAFAAGGRVILVRNHELANTGDAAWGGSSPGDALRRAMFDPEGLNRGGTTTLVIDQNSLEIERSYLSLAGTSRNCAGGPTPWGSWLSCEEPAVLGGLQPGHGYVFEVPARVEPSLTRPVPLREMGRFNHEACAVDPATGIVYMTEDRRDGLFYRFVPQRPGRLAEGGRLQALAITGSPGADPASLIAPGGKVTASWIELRDVDAGDDLRKRGHEAGAARFVRGEGLWRGKDGEIYFSCTEGGAAGKGQIWRYWPGQSGGGTLELFVEAGAKAEMEMPDNLTVAPWGGLVVCEDGPGDNYLRLVSRQGEVSPLGRHAGADRSEFAGACFAPDGRTLFVNLQNEGLTLAISGPWPRA